MWRRSAEIWVAGRCNVWAGAGRLGECVKNDITFLGLQPEWAMFRDMWRNLIWNKRLTLA